MGLATTKLLTDRPRKYIGDYVIDTGPCATFYLRFVVPVFAALRYWTFFLFGAGWDVLPIAYSQGFCAGFNRKYVNSNDAEHVDLSPNMIICCKSKSNITCLYFSCFIYIVQLLQVFQHIILSCRLKG